jgi:glucokinase
MKTDISSSSAAVRVAFGLDAGGTQLSLATSLNDDIISLPSDFGSMQDAVRWIVKQFGLPDRLLIGGAGAPDAHGNIKLTNRGWPVFNPAEFGEEIGCEIIVVNDMVIKAAALLAVDVEKLREGDGSGTKTVVTVSTGVGNAQLDPDGTIDSSEGGHTSWQPSNELEDDVLRALRRLYPDQRNFSVEDLIAGSQFLKLYDALNMCGYTLSPPDQEYIERCRDQGIGIGPFITDGALRGEPFCVIFVNIVGSLLGQYLRNIALFALADGGLYLTGGVMQPDVVRYLFSRTPLMTAFFGGSKHNERLADIAMYLVVDQHAGAKGALRLATLAS